MTILISIKKKIQFCISAILVLLKYQSAQNERKVKKYLRKEAKI